VRARVHIRLGLSDLGPSIVCFPHTTLRQPILSQNWAETSESLGQIISSELDPQPRHYTNNRLSFPSPDNSLGCTLYPLSISHFTRASPSPTPCQRDLVCGACIGTAQVCASLGAAKILSSNGLVCVLPVTSS